MIQLIEVSMFGNLLKPLWQKDLNATEWKRIQNGKYTCIEMSETDIDEIYSANMSKYVFLWMELWFVK